jgi:hypothetical protein
MNQRHLSGALDRIRRIMQAYAAAETGSWNPEIGIGSAYALARE